ncbi:MAG: NAD(+) synthase [Clostridiales bacterium]|nr:NAD(+) synthase [Clostridiales bacterium]
MKDGFIRVGAATPELKVADIAFNCEKILEAAIEAAGKDCSLLVFPELCITGYTCGDLFLQDILLDKAYEALLELTEDTAALDIVLVVGLPMKVNGKLYNTAAVISKGEILGFVPKRFIPNYSEFYELRHFTPFSGDSLIHDEIPFGRLVFENIKYPDFSFAVEICEDLWVAQSPSVDYALEGALIICNPSASDEVIGKDAYRRDLVRMQSAKTVSAYIYADAGFGESTQDLIFAGHDLIAENGTVLSESKKFSHGIIYADIDLKRLAYERRRANTFEMRDENVTDIVYFDTDVNEELVLNRHFSKTPFVPEVKADLDYRCEEILTMQATGLATRLKAINCKNAVIGLSGGLDSTLALIVSVHAFDMLGLDRKGITAVTMPCFGTTQRTKGNAEKLAEEFGVTLKIIDIKESVNIHFRDIGHDENVRDVTYENSQARERTQILMDIANQSGGIVVGTGDLSELALGWATYNGDHMSMYGVNSSIPKTLVRHLVSYEAAVSAPVSKTLSDCLCDIVDTPVSPELLPPTENGTISQKTEEQVGPYILHDFFLYYLIRWAYSPSKVYRIAKIAFDGEFDDDTIYKWEETFIRRFFAQQFKRSCLPDGPKVGTVTLSPRGDFRMPSDAKAEVWLSDLAGVK